MSIRANLSVPADEPIAGPAPGRGWRRLPFRNWGWRHFLFFVGVPAAVGLYAALNNWTILQLAGYENTLLFYAGHSFVPWWTSAIATLLVMRALSPWRPPQLVILVLGSFLACLMILPYSRWLTRYFAVGWLRGDIDGSLSSQHILSEIGFWTFTLRATVIWVLTNLAFDRFVGLPRYRYGTAAAPLGHQDDTGIPSAAAPAPGGADDASLRFLQRLPATVSPEEVIALKAEQHYIKVFTATRSFMTLYRFSDAVAEMDPGSGQQLHRSWWVRSSAIRAIRRDSRKYSLELVNGLQLPVSAAHRGLIREIARGRNIPVQPPL